MGKNRLLQIITMIVLVGVMVGCNASHSIMDEQVQQETNVGEEVQNQHKAGTDNDTMSRTSVGGEVQNQQEAESGGETETWTEVESETEMQTEVEPVTEVQTEVVTQMETEIVTDTEVQSVPDAQQPAAEGSISGSDYVVSVRGTVIALQGDMRDYVGAVGEPDAYSAARSCIEAGEDKVYTYGGIIIYTYVTNGADYITLIELTGSEGLPSGIHIGSTKDEVVAAYGSGYTEEGTEILYEMDGKTLGLQMESGKVSFIELFGR